MRDTQPVYLTEFDVKKIIADQKKRDEQKDKSAGKEKEVTTEISTTTEVDVSGEKDSASKETSISQLPPRTYFPKPTFSPTKDPFYLHTKKEYVYKKKSSLGGLSNEYIFKKDRKSAARFDDSGDYDFSYQRKEPISIDASRYDIVFRIPSLTGSTRRVFRYFGKLF